MACNATFELRGSLTVKDTAQTSCQPSSTDVNTLALKCPGFTKYQKAGDCQINSPTAFIEPGVSQSFTAVELLYIYTPSPLTVRIGGLVAILVGVGGVFPTGFVGGETLITQVDAFGAVTTTFTAAASTAQGVTNEINASYALQGIKPVASVDTSGQLKLSGFLTGAVEGMVNVTGGTAQVALGFASGSNDAATGSGSDLQINGTLGPIEFDRVSPPGKFELKGISSGVTILAAGTP